MSARDLSDCVVLVTGGSRGIGRASALAFAERGATVHVCSRAGDPSTTPHARITHHACDVSDAEQVVALARAIEARDARLDVLVHNAAILGPMGLLEGVDLDAARRAVDINVTGTINVVSAMGPLLRVRGSGVLIALSSSVGRAARAEWGVYSATKYALEALTLVASQELASDSVSCVSLNPGGTATDMRAEAKPDEDPSTLPTAERVAQTVVALCEHLTPAESGRLYASRDLFEVLDEPVGVWPHG